MWKRQKPSPEVKVRKESLSDMYQSLAPLYDSLMKNVDYRKWVHLIEELFQTHGKKPKTIVDLACGTGGVTNLLAAGGYQVTGVDISEDMLYVAREKARRSGLQVSYVCQDMSKLTLHRPVDAVLCMCDGFNYILTEEKLKQTLERVHRYLNPGGILVFDISSYYKLSSVLGNRVMADTNEDVSLIWLNHFDKEAQLLEMNLTFFEKQDELYRRTEETHIQRAWHMDIMMEILNSCGFFAVVTYAPNGLAAPTKRSHRIYFSAEKS